MHIAQLLDAFPFRPDIEIVKPLLPDVSRGIAEQTALRRLTFPLLPRQDASRKAQFQGLHHGRRILLLRFTDEKVDVLRHDHVAHDDKPITPANLLQDREKQIATACAAQQRLPPAATTSDEM